MRCLLPFLLCLSFHAIECREPDTTLPNHIADRIDNLLRRKRCHVHLELEDDTGIPGADYMDRGFTNTANGDGEATRQFVDEPRHHLSKKEKRNIKEDGWGKEYQGCKRLFARLNQSNRNNKGTGHWGEDYKNCKKLYARLFP